MAELSPAAQAGKLILAYRKGGDEVPHPLGLAAALEALADQVVPETPRPDLVYGGARWDQRMATRREILAIAAELRGGAGNG